MILIRGIKGEQYARKIKKAHCGLQGCLLTRGAAGDGV